MLIFWTWRTSCQPQSEPGAFLKPAMCFALAMMLMFSPHYPWYVAWLVPFFLLCPSLTIMTYVLGLFYMCTTALATGSGAPQFKLNEILYSAVLIAAVVELVLYHLPASRRYMRLLAPFSFAHPAFELQQAPESIAG